MKQLIAVVVVVFVSGACFSTTEVAPNELYRLNGFSGRQVNLVSLDGDTVKVDRKSSINIQAMDGQSFEAKFTNVNVDNTGLMTGMVRGSGAPVNIDITQVSAVSVKNYSPGRTAGLVVPLVVVPIVALIVGLVVAATAVSSGFSGGF